MRSLGIASSTSPAVVATVLGLVPLRLLVRCGVRDVALRADHGGGLGVDQVLQPGLEQTAEDVIVSKVRVGQDFPDQRGHGRLVTGHRGCTPCESWSKNWGSHDAPTRADDPGRKPRGNCHHTKRRTRDGRRLARGPVGAPGRRPTSYRTIPDAPAAPVDRAVVGGGAAPPSAPPVRSLPILAAGWLSASPVRAPGESNW